MHELSKKISVGVVWNLANLIVSRGSSAIFTIFLAKLLVPDAFGQIAIVMVFFELANALVNSGLGQAIIRAKHVTDKDLNTVFVTNFGISAIAYMALYVGSPYIAQFYEQQELTSVIRIAGLVVIINSFKVVQLSQHSRELNFKHQMHAGTISAIGSGIIAVTAAYWGAGVWSLVLQILTSALISLAVIWLKTKWRPAWNYSFASLRQLLGFGSHLLIENVLEILFKNSYVLFIGKIFSAELTGLYFFAEKISGLIYQNLTSAVEGAIFPALSKLQDENELLKHKFRRVIQVVVFLLAPVMLFLAAMAEALFSLFFADKWSGAVGYLQIFCVIGVLYPLHSINVNILTVKGRSDLVLRVGIVKKVVSMALLILSLPYGVLGIVIGQLIGSVLALLPNTYFSERLIGYSLKEQLMDMYKPAVAAMASAVFMVVLMQLLNMGSLINIAISLVIGAAVYLISCELLAAEGYVWIKDRLMQFRKLKTV